LAFGDKMVRIAVDAMGGDYAPEEIVKGAILAAKEETGVELTLVGRLDILEDKLTGFDAPGNITIEAAPEVIEMGENPSWAVRAKKNSSIVVGMKLVQEKKGDAIVSAGNTGAVVGAAFLILGRIKGISKPAIATIIPTPSKPVLLLDVGATTDCKPQNIFQFAKMGQAYLTNVLRIENPSIGILSIGEERGKGNELVQEAYGLLEKSKLKFIGNVEGRDILFGKADIVVCDGFTGNVALKLMEGMAEMFFSKVKSTITESFASRLGGLLLAPGLKKLKRKLDYQEYGGAQLLGINGVCIISHGSSKAKAIKNSIRLAADTVRKDVVLAIKESIENDRERE